MQRKPAIRIVTAYEDFAAAIRAKEMSEWLVAQLKPEFQIRSAAWKFESLRRPELRQYADADASEAHIVIVSAHGQWGLPAHVKSWMGHWFRQKRSGQAALVALLDHVEKTPGQPPALASWLRRMAQRGRIDFFCKAGDWWQQHFQYTIDTVNERSDSRMAPLQGRVDQSFFDLLRRSALMLFGNSHTRALQRCPGWTSDNSPAFQRRDSGRKPPSPERTAEWPRPFASIQPSRRDLNALDHLPGVETPRYFHKSLRNRPLQNFRKASGLAPPRRLAADAPASASLRHGEQRHQITS